jgi:hypothetical protein
VCLLYGGRRTRQAGKRKADFAFPTLHGRFQRGSSAIFWRFYRHSNVQQHPLPSLLDKDIVLGFWGHSFAAPGRQENPDKEGEDSEKTSTRSFFEVGLEC